MRPVSPEFLAAVYNTHEPTFAASVLLPTGPVPIDVLDGGSVNRDATAESAGSLDLVVPRELAPLNDTDMLAPYGNRVQVWRGIAGVGTTSLGVFRIEDMVDTTDGCRITGLDQSAYCIGATFEKSGSIKTDYGTYVVDAIMAMVQEAMPWAQFSFGTSPYQVPDDLIYSEGDDRWDYCRGLAEGLGCLLNFNADGICVLTPIPALSTPPIGYVVEGPGGSLLDADREWDRRNAKNKWIVTGNTEKSLEGSGVTPRGEATQTTGPTAYGSQFGKEPDYYQTDVARTHDHCAFIAETRKNKYAGITQVTPFESLPNPALEPLDVVRLTRQDTHIDDNVIIDSLTIPIGTGSMSAVTRSSLVAA